MSVEWYDLIARRNGGYKSNALFTVEGVSGEQIFKDRLIEMLPGFHSVLDAGCGHGEFTIKMSRYARSIIGFDNSIELIKIADSILEEAQVKNVQFTHASTKSDLPFYDGQFDLIYNRRGPTSILNHSGILKSGGTIFGIHSGALDIVKERLLTNGFINIEIEEFNNAIYHFPNEIEFAKFISAIPGNPDYMNPELCNELEKKIQENTIDGRLELKEYRYIWKAEKL